MLLNNSKELLIWTPYKNYSTSLHVNFRGPNGWVMVIGANTMMPGLLGPHTNQFTGPTADRLIRILPVRNPFNRVVSMWKFSQRFCDKENKLSFTNWFNKLGHKPMNGPVFSQYPHSKIVRCEHIVEDFKALGIDISNIPWENKSEDTRPVELTKTQKDCIRWFHREDFEAGRYPLEIN